MKLVWDAWTDPKQVAQWWGPRGFTITTHSKDLRVGGHWSYTMHGPDGTDWENKTIYYEVEKYSRLVYDHGGGEDRPPLFRVTVTFEEIKGGKTKMDMTMALATAEAAKETKKFIKQASGNSTWDRLAEFLDKESTGKEKFVINRVFEAPIHTMFEMWTNPTHFAKWLAPTGFNMKFLRSDIKPGATTFYCMENDSGLKMYGRAKYLEILAPNKLVYTQEFTDEKENQSRHPMAPTWPAVMQTTVLFAEESPTETRVTVTWEVVSDYTAEELETFIKGRAGMTQGWTGSFDKLEEYIASNRN
ncbi:SRPBCC family protein [Bdellovibrio sp. HCB185ZH]|uniref:SRPBCC family protein n=1 Tax=Bdellovibrio sp. HCB185ZH TaxID=3394235 RepID=UPI0039A6848A